MIKSLREKFLKNLNYRLKNKKKLKMVRFHQQLNQFKIGNQSLFSLNENQSSSAAVLIILIVNEINNSVLLKFQVSVASLKL